MQNKTVVVTGANSGIGKFSALELAKMGARVVMVCRNAAKAEAARQEIVAKVPQAQISIFLADFASQKQIHRVAQEILQQHPVIDVLLNNAGFIAGNTRSLSEDGYETTFAVNHLGYFTLTLLLLPALKAAPAARIVNVSSEAHRFVKELDWDNLQLEKGYSSLKAYALSKLHNILFTKALAKRLQGTSITTNCLHPGVVATNFGQSGSLFLKALVTIARPFFIGSSKGAETSIFLASSPEVAKVTGEYFDKKAIRKVNYHARSEENAEKLWQLSLQMTQLPEISL
ncbi:MAG TPA: retinol dehydrogenase [Microscillaceae bacterium]|nr:retinol dehydrogenase [Microscillaceae bacterium]